MWQSVTRLVISSILLAMIGGTAIAAPPDHAQNKDRAIERLKAENQGAQVSRSSATGTANFVRLPPGLAAKAADAQSQDEKAIAFVSQCIRSIIIFLDNHRSITYTMLSIRREIRSCFLYQNLRQRISDHFPFDHQSRIGKIKIDIDHFFARCWCY